MSEAIENDGPPIVRVDLSGVMARRIGARLGLSRTDRHSWERRLRGAADEVRQAAEEGVLPHYQWWAEPVDPDALELPVTVEGEPGAVDAVCLGLPEDDRLHRHEGPEAAFSVKVDGTPLQGETSSEDLRFGPFGPSARALRLACLGPDESAAVDEAIREAMAACSHAATDAGATLALGLGRAAWQGGVPTLICAPELLELGRWWARVLTVTTCKTTGESGPQVLRGLAPRVARLGDEAALQAAVFGQPASPVVVISGRRLSRQRRAELDATRDVLARRACPAVGLRLRGTGVDDQLAAAWVLLHSALTLAIAIGAQPLTVEAGEDLRRLMDSTGDASA